MKPLLQNIQSLIYIIACVCMLIFIVQCGKISTSEPKTVIVMELDESYNFSHIDRDTGIDKNIDIIRSRIQGAGIGDPDIQKSGDNRIIIELPATADMDRVYQLIGHNGNLEFRLVYEPDEIIMIVNYIHNYPLFLDSTHGNNTTNFAEYNIFHNSLQYSETGMIGVKEEHINKVNTILGSINNEIPNDIPGEFIWGEKLESASDGDYEIKYRQLYYVKAEVEISSSDIKSARASQTLPDITHTGTYVVDVQLTNSGTKKFSRTTARNIGSHVAIILDREVYMAPRINGRIPNGRTQISGLSTFKEAEDIVNILLSGQMAIPMNIIQQYRSK